MTINSILDIPLDQQTPENCAKANHYDWRWIDHFNLGRVHVCRVCNTVVGTG